VLEVMTGGKAWVESEAPPTPTTSHALIRLTGASGRAASGVVLAGALKSGSLLTEVLHPAPDGRLRVAVSGDTAFEARIRRSVAGLDGIDIVPATRASDVTLYSSATGQVDVYRGGVALPPTPAAELATLLTRLRAVKQVADLRNPPESAPLHVSVRTLGGAEGYAEAKIGETVGYEISVDHDAYVTVLDLAADGSITGMPTAVSVRAGSPLRLDGITVTAPAGLDILKVIATTFPLSIPVPAGAEDAATLGAAGRPEVIARRIVTALRDRINNEAAGARGQDFNKVTVSGGAVAPIATDGWASAELLLRIQKP